MSDADVTRLADIEARVGTLPAQWRERIQNVQDISVLRRNAMHLLNMLEEARADRVFLLGEVARLTAQRDEALTTLALLHGGEDAGEAGNVPQ